MYARFAERVGKELEASEVYWNGGRINKKAPSALRQKALRPGTA